MFESSCDAGYVFRKEFRYAYRIGLAFLAVGMLAFSVMMLDAARKPGSAAAACIVVAAIPVSFLVWIPISVKKYAWLTSLRFGWGSHFVTNTAGEETRYIQLDGAACCAKLSVPFYWGKGKSNEDFFLISKAPVSSRDLHGSGGLPVLRSIWIQTDAVILPANEDARLWVNSHFSQIEDLLFLT